LDEGECILDETWIKVNESWKLGLSLDSKVVHESWRKANEKLEWSWIKF